MTPATPLAVPRTKVNMFPGRSIPPFNESRTRPMGTGSPYRICDGCVEEARQRLTRSEDYCTKCTYLGSFHLDGRCPEELGPNGARAMAGNA